MKSNSKLQSANSENKIDHQVPGPYIMPGGRFASTCKSSRIRGRPLVAWPKNCHHESNKRSMHDKNRRAPTRYLDTGVSRWGEIIIDTKREHKMMIMMLGADRKNFSRSCVPFIGFPFCNPTSETYFEVESPVTMISNYHRVVACTSYCPNFVHANSNKVNF